VFTGDASATLYYLPGATGWGATFGGRPTALWVVASTATGGNWSSTGTWVGGVVPTATHPANIASVTLDPGCGRRARSWEAAAAPVSRGRFAAVLPLATAAALAHPAPASMSHNTSRIAWRRT
jgi:hypothetical protein